MSGQAQAVRDRSANTTSTASVLRLEGAVIMLAAVAAFEALGGSWQWFAALFLLPDLSMFGYLRGPRIGAFIYNLAHTYVGPAIFLGIWFVAQQVELLRVAAVWSAHIGLDRTLGFGLKDPTGFMHTHLQRI